MDLRASSEALAIRDAYRRGALTREETLARIEALAASPAPAPATSWGGSGRTWEEPPGLVRRGAALTARIGLPIVGGVVGGVPGAVLGGAAGETLGELLEGDALSARRIAVQGGLSAIPGIRAPGITSTLGRVGLRAAEGAAQGVVGTAATRVLGEGRRPTAGELATGAVLGAGLGAAAGGVEARLRRPAPTRAAPPPPDVGTPPPPPAASAVDELVQPAAARTAARRMFQVNPDEPMPPPVGPAERAAAARDAGKLERIEASVERLYGDMPEPAKAVLRDINSRYEDEILAATGGVQPITRTQQLAAAMEVDLQKLVPPGTPLDRTQVANLEGTQRALMARSAALLERTDLPDEVLGRELTTAAEDLKRLQTVIIGATSEAGGVLRYRREAVRRALPPLLQFQRAALESQADPVAVARAMKALGPTPTPRQMMQGLLDLQRTDWQTRARSLYLTNLLTNAKTHQRNMFGNFMRLVQDPALKPVAAGLDVARTAVTGGERRTFAGEVKPFVAGVVDGAPDAIRSFLQILRRGFSDAEALRLVLGDPKFQLPREVWRGPFKILNVTSRALSAMDALFRTMHSAGALRAAAYAQARRELLRKGRPIDRTALATRMTALVDTPTPALLDEVEHAAARSVFQEHPAAWVAQLNRTIEALPLAARAPVRMWLPFINTPANLIRQAGQVSPLGWATQAARESSRAGDTARAEAAFGTLLAGLVAYETVSGNIRGNAPADPKQRELFYQTGPENSVRLGDRWVQFTDLGHLGIAVGMTANLVQNLQRAGKPAPTTGEALGIGAALVSAVADAGGSVFDTSFLSGLGELFDAMRNPTLDELQRVGQRRLTSLVPLQGVLRPLAQAEDPYLRQPQGIGETLATQLPGQSQTVPPRLGAFGEPQARAFTGARSAFVILPSAPVGTPDPVFAELDRLGIPPAAAKRGDTLRWNRRIYAITREEDLALRQAQGRAQRAALATLLASPWYARQQDERRRSAAQSVRSRAGAGVRAKAAARKAKGLTLTEEALR